MWIEWRDRRLFALALVVPLLAAAGADDLAMTIEQNLAGIAFRIEMRPGQAADDLEAQGRQLELLAKEAPDHPAQPKLEETYQTLQDELATALVDAASESRDQAAIQAPPEGFIVGMEEVETLEQRAQDEFFGGHPDRASGYLKQALAQIAVLERRYGDQIPRGHVPLLVAKEKLAALEDQLADRQ
jgi:hypothetical protein